MIKNINELENFFELDLDAKKLIEASRPNLYNPDPVEIEKNLKLSLQKLRKILYYMTRLSFSGYYVTISDKLDIIQEQIESCDYDTKKLQNVYEKYFLCMNDDVSESLQCNVGGYQVFSDSQPALNSSSSVNDLLHVLHFSLINNENTFQSMNVIEERENKKEYPIVLYGIETKMARDIYDKFSDEIDCSYTDIVGFKNHTLLMVRDKGHALSIDAEEEGENVRINYFIPKISNVDMVNRLPGIREIPSDSPLSASASGEFVVAKSAIGETISDFVSKVPTDFDNPNNIRNIIENVKTNNL